MAISAAVATFKGAFRGKFDRAWESTLEETLEDVFRTDPGQVITMRLAMPNNAADTNTIGIPIGPTGVVETYEFVNTGVNSNVAANGRIGVVIGGSAAATRANLIAAINATYATNEHATLKRTDGTTPALCNGSGYWFADEFDTNHVRLRSATGPGGTMAPASGFSGSFAESITDASDIWVEGNINCNTLLGRGPAATVPTVIRVPVTTALLTKTTSFHSLPGDRDVTVIVGAWILTSAKKMKAWQNDTIEIVSGDLKVTYAGQAGDMANTDTLIALVI